MTTREKISFVLGMIVLAVVIRALMGLAVGIEPNVFASRRELALFAAGMACSAVITMLVIRRHSRR